jgi:hypothetical protein
MIDANTLINYQIMLKTGDLGPLPGAEAALKYSPNPPGRLLLPSVAVFSLVVQLTEPCPTGLWQIVYYGFGIENALKYRVSIGVNPSMGWVSARRRYSPRMYCLKVQDDMVSRGLFHAHFTVAYAVSSQNFVVFPIGTAWAVMHGLTSSDRVYSRKRCCKNFFSFIDV